MSVRLPTPSDPSSTKLTPEGKKKLWSLLFGGDDPNEAPRDLFALLDGAMVRQLPDFLEDEEVEHAPLLPPATREPEEITRATYLTRVERDSTTADWLASSGWGEHWGIFIAAPAGTAFDDMLGHLREMAQVRLPDGRIVFFRFYDPRVWRTFLPSCDMPQQQHLFSLPVIYGCEMADEPGLILDFLKDGTAQRVEHTLNPVAST